MRSFPDGASRTAWKPFEETFKVFITESSHAVSCSNNEQRNSLGRSFCFLPSSVQPPPGCGDSHWNKAQAKGFLFVSSRLCIRKEYSTKQPSDPTTITGAILIMPDKCYFQLLSLRFSSPHSQSTTSPMSSLLCSALCCPAALTAGGSLEAYLKPCHGGQMGMFFLKHTETCARF